MITVEKTFQGYRLSAIKNNQLVTMHYIDYTRKECVAMFKRYLKELK